MNLTSKIFVLIVVFVYGCCGAKSQAKKPLSLAEARHGFTTRLLIKKGAKIPVPTPPSRVLRIVQYPTSKGKFPAYVTPTPRDKKRRPAIIWITGGDCNSIDEGAWEGDLLDDQSARAFREKGIVMMYPSLRGGNANPGYREGFFGEVDDILAAAEFLVKQPFVDPKRIYLGGHSTGGTLALLVAECSPQFRAVFAFGPVEDIISYGLDFAPFDIAQEKEWDLRTPEKWLHSVQSPLFIFEGKEEPCNLTSLQHLASKSRNPLIQCFPVEGADHFNILSPITQLIATKILADKGTRSNLQFRPSELSSPFLKGKNRRF